ncbi:MAG: hypothetical protein COV66_04085 [Nitrospinae bacterium CG11_big_fil_rev_8_21_14_0_20_45_15]|nr:MAG: hypothetical protein COV66_04085 [Nitrospinae bacterium CG11_big_fil_rev_8_21_14_0_20_45_15]
MQLKILTFNWHEPYICLLARVGWEFFVVEPEVGSGQRRHWDYNMRPLPSNVTIVSAEEAKERLQMESFDLVIANNIKDLVWVKDYALPKISVFHCRLSTEIAIGNNQVDCDRYLKSIEPVLRNVRNVFISESKRKDWGLEGEVIPHGLDVADYKNYEGGTPAILRVGNLLKEMDVAKGFGVSEQIINGFPCITLGLNPTIADSRLSRGLDDLLEHYRQCRVYLNTTMERYEDGYNLSLLEAMASGMPIVSYKHSGSPIVDGVNGFISEDIDRLKENIAFLLENPDCARKMGEKARNTIRRDFSLEKFLDSWRKVIHSTLVDFLKNSGISMHGEAKEDFFKLTKKNIILEYVSHPATTAHYLERALRRKHNVVTCGAQINELVREKWDLGALKWEAKSQDIPCDVPSLYSEVEQRLPIGWVPDLYFWVETGLSQPPKDLDQCKIPKACYLIDTHIHLEQHLDLARPFDFVFLAQKAYVEDFRRAGFERVYWLPLACDPEIHGKVEGLEKQCDVGFVGTVEQAPIRRKELLLKLDAQFDLKCERKFMEEMAELYSHSRIVFNNAIRKDLNMRVFEGMCSGSMLLTDPAKGSGLEDFFQDGVHLALYQDDTLTDTVRYYLDHPEERNKIAEQGRAEVLAKHTYDHRMIQMICILDDFFQAQSGNAKSVNTPVVKTSDESISDKPETYFSHVRRDLFPLIPDTAQCILEVGCGEGATGAELKRGKNVFVAGIELDSASAEKAKCVLDEVLQGNVETMTLPYGEQSFDCIIFGDILEHLIDPLSLLKKVRPLLKPGGNIVASIPNVQFYAVVGQLAEGNWTYQKEGILDETHLRFFTFKEIKKLFETAGFEIDQTDETLDPQYASYNQPGVDTIKMGRVTISDLSPEEMRQFFVFQYKVSAIAKKEMKGTLDGLTENSFLAQAEEAVSKKNWQLALKFFQDNEALEPDCIKTTLGLAKSYMHLGDVEKAEPYYVKSLNSSRPPIEARLGMGVMEFQRGNYSAAIGYLENARNLEPENDKVLTALGMALMQTGEKEKAHDVFVCALESNVENTLAMNEFLNLSYALNRFEDAERLLTRFLELHPANLHILFGLAGVQFASANTEKAKDTLNTLLIFDPVHVDARKLMDRILGEESYVSVY